MPPRLSSRRGATGPNSRREEPEEETPEHEQEFQDEEDEDYLYNDERGAELSDDDDSDDSDDDDGSRPGELTVTTAGGVRIVLARSNDDDEGAEAERSARGRRRRSRRLREEQERQGAGANTSTDPETAAAAASAARLAHELSLRCTPAGPRGDRFLREMMRRSACAGRRQEEQEDEQQETTPRARRRRQHSSPRRSSSSPSAATAPLSPTTPPPLAAASATLSTAAILRARERGAAGGGGGASSSWAAQPAGFGAAARAYLTTGAFAPASVAGLGDDPRPSRAYVGFYTNSGNLFVCGYQNDRRIRVYECGPDGLGVVCGGGGSSGGGNDDVDGSGVGECGWRLVKDISCRLLRWTVTDALCVPGGGGGDGENEAKLLYSTISPTVHCVTLSSSWNDDDDDGDENGGDVDGGSGEGSNNRNRNRNDRNNRVRSIANTTDVHEPLNFDEMLGAPSDEVLPEFGIWSIRWNPVASGGGGGGGGGSGNNIGGGGGSNSIVLAGASDGCCYLFDAERGKTVARYARAHGDDVNAVVYLAGSGGGSGGSGSSSTALSSSPEVFASGSDDGYIKVWDARVPSGAAAGSSVAGNNDGATAFHAVARPVGVLVGHAAGITYLDARGDGHHLLSNSKDQTAKLWDLRSGLRGPAAAAAALAASPPPPPSLANFDYRWMPYPRSASGWRHGADASAVTFGGHEVLSTLIRARFSPLESTGGRFAYSGSSDGRVRIWDLATGELVRSLPAGMNVAGRAAARASREEEEEDDDGGGDDRGRAAAAAATSAGNDGFGQLDPVRDVSWHPSGTALAAASFDGSITVFGPRGCRRRRGGSGGGGGSGSIFFGGGAENPRRRVTMLPIQDDEDDGDGDDDYEPW